MLKRFLIVLVFGGLALITVVMIVNRVMRESNVPLTHPPVVIVQSPTDESACYVHETSELEEDPYYDAFFHAEFGGIFRTLVFAMRPDASCPFEPLTGDAEHCYDCRALLNGEEDALLRVQLCPAFHAFARRELFWGLDPGQQRLGLARFEKEYVRPAFVERTREPACIRRHLYRPSNLPTSFASVPSWESWTRFPSPGSKLISL